MPKNTLLRSSCKNYEKNRGNKTQKILNRQFLKMLKFDQKSYLVLGFSR